MVFLSNKGFLLLLTAGLIFFCGCAGKHAPSTLLPVLGNPAAYLDGAVKKSQSLSDVSGYAKLKITAAGQSSSTRNIFFVRKPDRIRIETLGFLSRPALVFAANGTSMSMYVVQNNAVYSGQTTAENFERIIGMRLELPEIVLAFMGQPPLAACTAQRVSCSEDNKQYLFTIACAGRKQLIWIDPVVKNITRYKLYENKSPVYEYSFSRFQQIGGRLFPLKINIHHYTYTSDISLELESLSFDAIADDRFSINQGQGAHHYAIEDLGPQN